MNSKELRKKLDAAIAAKKKAEKKERDLKTKLREAENAEKMQAMQSIMKTLESVIDRNITLDDFEILETYLKNNSNSLSVYWKEQNEIHYK